MKYKYTGSDTRVFPTLSLVVKPNEEFEAPENLDLPDVAPTNKSTVSAAPDLKVGE